MSPDAGFTERVRQELSRAPFDAPATELAGILRLVGRLHRTGGPGGATSTRMEVVSTSGAVIRRVFGLLAEIGAERPQLWVREPSGLRTRTSYGAALVEVEDLISGLGLVDRAGRPVPGFPASVREDPPVAVRACLVAATSLSAPGKAAHVEVAVPSTPVAVEVVDLLAAVEVAGRADPGRDRVVIKSLAAMERLLEVAGAEDARAEVGERRDRRRLRNEATRLANADGANVRRTIEAAQQQLDMIERVVERVGWGGMGEELRNLALARMVNPTASLAELGELCDPPVGKSAVHRRLERLRELADQDDRAR